jgi:hypothetical protein
MVNKIVAYVPRASDINLSTMMLRKILLPTPGYSYQKFQAIFG